MKQVILLVPDTIIRKLGRGTSGPEYSHLRVNEYNLKKILTRRLDYHEDYYFDNSNNIRVVKIKEA